MLNYGDLLGICAACCTTLAFIPQAVKTIRTKDTRAISAGMYVLFTAGVWLWFFYGLVKHDPSIIAANGLTGILAVFILYHKLKNDFRIRKPDRPKI